MLRPRMFPENYCIFVNVSGPPPPFLPPPLPSLKLVYVLALRKFVAAIITA
jgi:hypothetical protein